MKHKLTSRIIKDRVPSIERAAAANAGAITAESLLILTRKYAYQSEVIKRCFYLASSPYAFRSLAEFFKRIILMRNSSP